MIQYFAAQAKNQYREETPLMPGVTLTGAGHFLQEDVGPELAAVVIDLIARG